MEINSPFNIPQFPWTFWKHRKGLSIKKRSRQGTETSLSQTNQPRSLVKWSIMERWRKSSAPSERKQGGRKHPEVEASSLLWPGGSTGKRARCVKTLTAHIWMTRLALGATRPHSTNSETLDTNMVIETGQNSIGSFLWMCYHQGPVGSRSHEVTSWEPLYPCQRVSLMSKWKIVYEGALRSRKRYVRMKW